MNAFDNPSGKIGPEEFRQVLLPRCGHARKEVRTGPKYGVDTSVIDLGGGLGMAVSSDPLSLIPSLGLKESAWLSVHLLANDMATTGFAPMYAQFVLNLPPDLSMESFSEYWGHIDRFCKEIGVAVTGGHTGQIMGQNSTISGGGTMFLTAPIGDILTSDRAGPGDEIVMTGEAALTATSILAMSFPETVRNRLGKEAWETACANFYRTSSLQDGLHAADRFRNDGLKAMHDVTEGGVLGAVSEMAAASGCGFRVDSDKIPAGRAPEGIAALFGIDHRICVGAGSMIMAVSAERSQELVNHLNRLGTPATAVGRITAREQGFRVVENGEEKPFGFDGKDPYWEAFFRALNEGWR